MNDPAPNCIIAVQNGGYSIVGPLLSVGALDPDKSQNPVGDIGAGYNPLPLILIYGVLGYIGYKWGYKLGRGRHE